jgi:hypothetical protein
MTHRFLLATTLACCALFPVPAALAEEAPPDPLLEKIVEHEALVAKHKQEKAYQALVTDARTALALYKEGAGKDPYRERSLALIGTIVRATDEDAVVKSGLEALGETADLDGAKYVKPLLRQPNPKESSPILVAAIAAAAKLPASDLVEPLLQIVDDSKVFATSAAAMEALGHFGACKHKREKILLELAKTVEKNKPGQRPRPNSNQGGGLDPDPSVAGTTGTGRQSETAARWIALAPVLPKAANELTGQKLQTAEEWFDLVKENKSRLEKLFRDDR